jgi:hypothetical protein
MRPCQRDNRRCGDAGQLSFECPGRPQGRWLWHPPWRHLRRHCYGDDHVDGPKIELYDRHLDYDVAVYGPRWVLRSEGVVYLQHHWDSHCKYQSLCSSRPIDIRCWHLHKPDGHGEAGSLSEFRTVIGSSSEAIRKADPRLESGRVAFVQQRPLGHGRWPLALSHGVTGPPRKPRTPENRPDPGGQGHFRFGQNRGRLAVCGP